MTTDKGPRPKKLGGAHTAGAAHPAPRLQPRPTTDVAEEATSRPDLSSQAWDGPTLSSSETPTASQVRDPSLTVQVADTGRALGPATDVDPRTPSARRGVLPRASARSGRAAPPKPTGSRAAAPRSPTGAPPRPAPLDEAPTDSFPALRVTTDPRQAALERTASVPAMAAVDDDTGSETIEAVVPRGLSAGRAPAHDSGMHSVPEGRAEALQPIQALIPWGAADRALASALQRAVITPAADEISRSFFATLRAVPLARIFLGRAQDQARLVTMLAGFLRSYTDDALTDDWVAARVRMAHAHARVGIPLGLYLASCTCLEGIIAGRIARSPLADKAGARDTLRRLMATESALVSQTFHAAQVDALNDAMREQAQSGFLRRYGAQIDPVTLLARPEHLRRQLDAALVRSHGPERGCALVSMRLRGLDEAAFHRGYAYRDTILAETGARVRATLRGADVAGIEPDGCVLALLNGVKATQVAIVAGRLRAAMEDVAFTVDEHSFRQAVDVGVALPGPAEAATDVIARALADLPVIPAAGRDAGA